MAMFDFGRELRRWFSDKAEPPFQDGLTGGEPTLLELLDLDMLRAEARAADLAAGRVSTRERAERALEAAAIWREIARRSGDEAALRKAARLAERAAAELGRAERPRRWAAARLEQARAVLIGADLSGEGGVITAADFALAEAAAAAGPGLAAVIAATQALVVGRQVATDREDALRAARRFDAPLRDLEGQARRGGACARLVLAGARADRAELLIACGKRLNDAVLLRLALEGLTRTSTALDPTYEPLTWARVNIAKGAARAALAELEGDVGAISEAVSGLVSVIEQLGREHSPMDWAQAQLALAGALQLLGEAGDNARAFEQAAGCYERALVAFGERPTLPLRAIAAHGRVMCLVQGAELAGDAAGLDEAAAALRQELRLTDPARDPVAWAVRQLSFAQIAEARAAITGSPSEGAGLIGLALSEALDVFAEHGLRSLTDAAARGLERLRLRATQS
jgi:hypothetical protein